ncbi:filamentous haemagglutinin family protein [Sphingomonas sp. PB4P5]|uniref:filamentous haemagglutinin family protein n=1 Tax=Parasphingomonas puruogangriensis TaxID=3096155 RepID=UPI002FCC9372
MTLKTRSLRSKLLIGASIGSILCAGAALAQSGRGRGGGSANPADAATRAAQAQAARAAQTSSASQRAVNAFRRAAAGRSAMSQAQTAARAAAQAAQSTIRNGLGQGGLQVADGVAIDPALWSGAKGPTETVGSDGRTKVDVEQTQQKAILTWDTFNVGRETDLTFKQGNADWVVLNRVTDVSADPSKILGSIKADGTVLLLNRNGVIFGGASQVNVRNLVASAANITNDQFLGRGIYSALSGTNYLASFTDAGGAVTVEAGARIATNTPPSVTAGGGYVLLMGTEVTNAGSILTPRGQATLAAGDDFIVRRGYGTLENPYSTTRGNEVRGLIDAGSTSGTVTNSGQIEAAQGDITLAGRTIRQDGVLVATTGVNQRGTIHLLNSATDTLGSVTLGKDSLTLVLPELDSTDTALNAQRDALATASDKANFNRPTTTTGGFDDRSLVADRLDQGRVEIVTGGNVLFAGGSQTMANGGQVAVQANAGRVTVAGGASIDVSGAMGVALDMASNSIKVNVQGNELRDSPDNRDGTGLKNQNVWVDVRDLVLLPSGTGGYDGDRWYTQGGLLEVGGYLANTAHGIGEWAAIGGTITLAAKEVVAEKDAVFDISGGSLDYAAGYVRSSLMLGADGRLYDVRNAPAFMKFIGVGNAFLRKHERWGSQYDEVYANRLFSRGTTMRWEDGYSVGRDAGRLILSTPTAVMEATILAGVINGERQTIARADGVTDGYDLGQHSVAKAGTLALGGYDNFGRSRLYDTDVKIGAVADITGQGELGDALAADRVGTAWFDAERLSGAGLGGLEIGTLGAVSIGGDLTLAAGGSLDVTAPILDIAGTVTARGGAITVTNRFRAALAGSVDQYLVRDGVAGITLGSKASIDVRGVWANGWNAPDGLAQLGHIDGGSVSLQNTQNVMLVRGSAIDASSGGAILSDASFVGGRGGAVSLVGGLDFITPEGSLTLDGSVRGHGAAGGGKLLLQAARVRIGGAGDTADDGTLVLGQDFFDKGFGSYEIVGNNGLVVADGATVDVTMPVYRQSTAALTLAAGSDPALGMELWTPPLYQEDPQAGVLHQRGGASLYLRTTDMAVNQTALPGVELLIGRGATISVDPGQRLALGAANQITVQGRLNAWGGVIDIQQIGLRARDFTGQFPISSAGYSTWIGEDAVLDVAARAATAIDAQGRRYGLVADGGQILIGGSIDHATGRPDVAGNFVVIRDGALLDASGAQATLDLGDRRNVTVASDGGLISLGSVGGLYLHGDIKAAAGGVGAAGGTLDLALGTTMVRSDSVDPRLAQARELVISQQRGDADAFGTATPQEAAASLIYGHGALSVTQIQEGGFGNLGLAVNGQISFAGTVDLTLGQSARFYAKSLALAETASDDSRISITAPYLLLAGAPPVLSSDIPGLTEASVGGTSARDSNAALLLKGGLIDVRDIVNFGAGGTLPGVEEPVAYDRRGFADIDLVSSGDLRFLAQSSDNVTSLTTAHTLTMIAAQLYPATHALALVTAKDITIGRSGTATPAQPYSVFGQLQLQGETVNQGGIIRAPLGAITLGQTGTVNSTEVNLLAGSITSVSANGLVMPYGGTVDGVAYSYAGENLDKTVLSQEAVRSAVNLQGQSIHVADGAVIDLSGGGDLTGAGFVSGRGGSVDVLRAGLAAANPGYGVTIGGSQVYALVPSGGAVAPISPDAGAGNPMIGQQITLDTGVAGLPAGTYTLMPSTYALLPGAFRAEIATTADPRGISTGAVKLDNGSHLLTGRLGVAGTGIGEALTRQVIVTPGTLVRNYSLYNEMSFADFVVADAARLGVPRVRLPRDVQELALTFARNRTDRESFSFAGDLLNTAAKDGWGGNVVLMPAGNRIEVVAEGKSGTENFVTLTDTDINALGAGRLLIGGTTKTVYGQSGNFVDFDSGFSTAFVAVRSGATLSASEIFLISGAQQGGITVEQGATLTTLGKGTVGQDSRDGFIYAPRANGVLAVSNGYLTMLAPKDDTQGYGSGRIDIGGCTTVCSGVTSLYSEGTIVAATDKAFTLDNAVRYGTRNLTLAVGGINVGSAAAIAGAAATNILPAGLELNQTILDRLLRGDTSTGAPVLETLTLTARDSINFFGTVTLDTIDPATGKSRLANLVLSSGGIYGHGTASDVATIRTGNLIWNGSINPAAAVMAGGAGTGSGIFNIDAQRIEFGFAPDAVTASAVHDRLALGFATVNLTAAERITANHKGTLSVYQSQGEYTAGTGFAYSGGNLNITAPLITGTAGSTNKITAGGAVLLTGAGTPGAISDLGGELSIRGQTLTVETAIVLPSGKLTLGAVGDLMLGDEAKIDLAGRAVPFDDITKYSWGGEVILDSREGNIRQTAASVIDLSAKNNAAGVLRATALGSDAGLIDLQGSILGSASGEYDAGGSIVPYRAGMIDLRAHSLGDFAALNTRLNTGGVFGARAFQIKQGDLTIGDEVKAGDINISLDNGHLTIAGKVDASGVQVGRIRLAGGTGLTLAGTGMLDAHGTGLRVDSYGKIIDSPNRAIVELSSGAGMLTLATGAHIDLRHGTGVANGSGAGQNDGRPRGTLELNAPRIGTDDVAIDARGTLAIDGARLIAVNAVRSYGDDDVPTGTEAIATGRPYKVIDQAWMDQRHGENTAFIDAALGNTDLMGGKLAGLNNAAYRDAFHLRPSVEVKTSGDLVLSGDLDLSGYRYDGVNLNTPLTGVYGSGEVGKLTLRAGGDLTIFGSITDGFAPPPEDMPEKTGWVLQRGEQMFNTDVIVPRGGIELHNGTTFLAGGTLNYDLPIQAMTMVAGTRLPAAAALAGNITLPADTILSADIRDADGNIAFAKGTRLTAATTLTAGMILGAGTILSGPTDIAAMIWPKNVPLPHKPIGPSNTSFDTVVLDGIVTLPMGGVIPAGAVVVLADGVDQIELRAGGGGRTWALAQMLPEGSQSWSMQLVAGADLGAANPMLTNPNAVSGRLLLADTHYGMDGAAAGEIALSAFGSLDLFGDGRYAGLGGAALDAAMIAEFGQTFADYFGEPLSNWCAYGDYCTVVTPVGLNDQGSADIFGDNRFAGLLAAELDAAVMAEFGLTFADYTGVSLADYCTFGAYCVPIGDVSYNYTPGTPTLSVLRTGTGDIDLASAGDLSVRSLYGIYTAGTSTLSLADSRAAGLDAPRGTSGTVYAASDLILGSIGHEKYVDGGEESLYRAWYPDHGGNLGVTVGGNLTGDLVGRSASSVSVGGIELASSDVSNWLWRQTSVQGLGRPTAWWINFGTYATASEVSGTVGFTGFGTLGGGNLNVRVGGDAGMINQRGSQYQNDATRSEGLVLAVGSTGRVVDGVLVQTGGGDIDVRISGGLNAAAEASGFLDGSKLPLFSRHDLNGAVVNLRGTVSLDAGSIGSVETVTGADFTFQDSKETRAYSPFIATKATSTGGLLVAPGDATVRLNTRDDLVLGTVIDGTRTQDRNGVAYQFGDASGAGGGYAWFSLWTDRTAIDLFSAGGNMTPNSAVGESNTQFEPLFSNTQFAPTDGRYIYPSIVRAVAASGSLYYGPSGAYDAASGQYTHTAYSMMLSPGPNAQLEFLAAKSIYAGGYAVTPSGADMSTLVTPFNPGFGYLTRQLKFLGYGIDGGYRTDQASLALFGFGPNTIVGGNPGAAGPARFYARDGDIVGLRTGEILDFSLLGTTRYEGSRPVWIKAGRDIVNSGTNLGAPTTLPRLFGDGTNTSTGNLFVHNNETDVSMVSAGRDILYSSFSVAGPGTLELTAGRNILMEDRATVTSIGAIAQGDTRLGASIAMTAGGVALDFAAIRKRYLDPANLADPGRPLADAQNQGKVVKLYSKELGTWLEGRYGFTGTGAAALTYFDALAPEQQRVFLRDVYYAELREGGREYNDPDSARFGSYLRGRDMIATLAPDKDAGGAEIVRTGDILMYGGSGVRTNFGGDIQMLVPGGQIVVGVQGEVPPSTAGLVTQGQGDIQLFSEGSLLMGLSRIMTTFGGDIFAWSEEGDINAGRGSKSTIVFTPPRRTYDAYGNVVLAPDVPSSGAGIATLNPIPEVAAGDVDLIAPLGTIDAGEAGIRVSGNVNLAALQVINAANIQVQGDSKGIPLPPVVNVGALTAASSATSSVVAEATRLAERARPKIRPQIPMIITARFVGFGEEN